MYAFGVLKPIVVLGALSNWLGPPWPSSCEAETKAGQFRCLPLGRPGFVFGFCFGI